jgi:hypothetical protein
MADSVDSALAPEIHFSKTTKRNVPEATVGPTASIRRLKMHAIDRVYQNIRAIRCLSVVLDYTVEKNAADEDGPTAEYIQGQIDAILLFADQIESAMDEILDERETERQARQAA